MLNDFDLELLDILSDDCRVSPAQLAVMTGKSEAEVTSAIARLEKDRVLIKYPAMINWDRVREDKVQALIEVRVTPQRDEGFDVIAGAFRHTPRYSSPPPCDKPSVRS